MNALLILNRIFKINNCLGFNLMTRFSRHYLRFLRTRFQHKTHNLRIIQNEQNTTLWSQNLQISTKLFANIIISKIFLLIISSNFIFCKIIFDAKQFKKLFSHIEMVFVLVITCLGRRFGISCWSTFLKILKLPK